VYLPAFICRDVLAPVHELGGRVEFYDVDPMLQPIVPDQPLQARAVLAVNYFGFPQHLDGLRAFATDVGAILIEDNAHGYLSRDSNGVELGRRTGLGFTSFRKTLRVVNGAFLDVDLSVFPNASQLVEPAAATTRLPIGHQLRRLTSSVERTTRLPLLNLGRAAVRAGRQLVGRPIIPEFNDPETTMPEHQSIHASALRAMQRVDAEREVTRRQQMFYRIVDRLSAVDINVVFTSLPANTAPWCVAFYADPTQLVRARRAVRGLGVEIFAWPDLPANVANIGPDFYSQVYVISMMK
jgi:hypothetical protein